MNHQLVLQPDQFSEDFEHIITKLPDVENGDQLTFTKEGTREQKVMYVTKVVIDKINKPFALLLLSKIRPLVDDIPANVGAGPGNNEL